MIDTSRRYTQHEAEDLERLGYEFESVQGVYDPEPLFVVSRYDPPPIKIEPELKSPSALDFITLDQLRALRAAGLVVVHSVPPKSMFKAGMSIGKYHYHGAHEYWHRMVAESIRLQNKAGEE